jgi:hypothetical protein
MEKVRKPRPSEAVASIGHDRAHSRLFVRFKQSSRLYVYFDVPRSLFYQMRRAASKGRFVHRRLIGRFYYARPPVHYDFAALSKPKLPGPVAVKIRRPGAEKRKNFNKF